MVRVNRLLISTHHFDQMRRHVIETAPEEGCGIACGKVQGSDYLVEEVFSVYNSLRSNTRFRMDPTEQLRLFNLMEERGWELVAIYHSHPNGPQNPSPTDVSEAYYPEVVYLIWAKPSRQWKCKGFLIQNREISEIPIEVL